MSAARRAEGGLDDASLARWRSVLTDLVTGGEVVVILAAHGATALDNVPITELRPTPP